MAFPSPFLVFPTGTAPAVGRDGENAIECERENGSLVRAYY